MARLLFNLHSVPSHIFTFIGILKEAERRGHALEIFSASPDAAALLERAGIQARVIATRNQRRGSSDLGLMKRLANPAWRQAWLVTQRQVTIPAHVEELRSAIAAFDPDLVCTDAISFPGAFASELERRRWVSIATTFLPVAPLELCVPFMEELRFLGLDPAEHVSLFPVKVTIQSGQVFSPHLNLVLHAPELVQPWLSNAPAPVVAVGPAPAVGSLAREFPFERLDPRLPLIYASHGTTQAFPESVFTSLVEGLATLPCQVVLGLFDLAERPCFAPERLPPNVIAARHVPQVALLERAAVVLTHGGANSMMEALSFGVPMIVVPLRYDTPVQAELASVHGFGLRVELEHVTPSTLGDAVRAILAGDSPHRQRARALARHLTGAQTPARVVDAIEALAARG